jgi:hypothetical protein
MDPASRSRRRSAPRNGDHLALDTTFHVGPMGFLTHRGGDACVSQTNVSDDTKGQDHSVINRNLCHEIIRSVADLILLDGENGNQHVNDRCSFGSMVTGPTPTVGVSVTLLSSLNTAWSITQTNCTFMAENKALRFVTENGTSNA